MSTNSSIAILKVEAGKKIYRGVYCHWDGYPAYNGAILLEHYNTQEAVEKLISYGDMSSLREHVEPREGEAHTFEKPQKDVCVYYHRDREEEWEHTKPFEAEKAVDFYKRMRQEYNYLFVGGEWFWNRYGEFMEDGTPMWEELTEADCE